MDRRQFLTRSGLALGALVVGDEAIDAFARMTHVRKSFPSAGVVAPRLADWRVDHYGTATMEVYVGDGRWVAIERAALRPDGSVSFVRPVVGSTQARIAFTPGHYVSAMNVSATLAAR